MAKATETKLYKKLVKRVFLIQFRDDSQSVKSEAKGGVIAREMSTIHQEHYPHVTLPVRVQLLPNILCWNVAENKKNNNKTH